MKRRGFLGTIGAALAAIGLPAAAKKQELTPVLTPLTNDVSRVNWTPQTVSLDRSLTADSSFQVSYTWWHQDSEAKGPVVRSYIVSKAHVEGMIDALMVASHDMNELRDLVSETRGTVTDLKITAL